MRMSDPATDFQGADLYLLPNELGEVDTLSPQKFKKKLPEKELHAKYVVDQRQGAALMHPGRRLHGVLPITGGVRHTLILMYLDKV